MKYIACRGTQHMVVFSVSVSRSGCFEFHPNANRWWIPLPAMLFRCSQLVHEHNHFSLSLCKLMMAGVSAFFVLDKWAWKMNLHFWQIITLEMLHKKVKDFLLLLCMNDHRYKYLTSMSVDYWFSVINPLNGLWPGDCVANCWHWMGLLICWIFGSGR